MLCLRVDYVLTDNFIFIDIKHIKLINHNWGLKTIMHVCGLFDCSVFIGHTFYSFVKIYDNVISHYFEKQQEFTTHGHSSTPSDAHTFMCIASLVVALTCTPDSWGTVDMEVYDGDLIRLILFETHAMVSVEHIARCRDVICKLYGYNFSLLRAPIKL